MLITGRVLPITAFGVGQRTCDYFHYQHSLGTEQFRGIMKLHQLLRNAKSIALAQLTLAAIVLTSAAAQAASFGYITGTSNPGGGDGNPWDTSTNDQAMDTAFGAGNWDKLSFGNAVGSGIFNPDAYKVLFFDGSDSLTDQFRSFLDTNRTALESWVAAGGSLFLNAARNTSFGDLDLGFNAILHNDYYDTASYTGTAYDPTHPIFAGPHGATGTSFSGNSFAHDTVIGVGLTSLINGSNGSVLAEKSYGLGRVLFGGMTAADFHSPQPQAQYLRANILSYAESKVGTKSVPEPGTVTGLLAIGSLGIGGILKRKQKQAA